MTYLCHICDEPITETMLEDAKAGTFYHPDCLPVEARPEPPPVVETPPLPEWVRHYFNPLLNLMDILEDFEDRGVQFRVHDGRLQYLDPNVALSEAEHCYISDAADRLRQAVWKRCHICTRCGEESAYKGAEWGNESIRQSGWLHYQRLSSHRKKKKQPEAEPTAVQKEERGSLWD